MENVEIEKNCCMCEHASFLHDRDHVLCQKKGVVSAAHKCGKFVYDPLKRIPHAVPQKPRLEFVPLDK